jgi:hypothetical protein
MENSSPEVKRLEKSIAKANGRLTRANEMWQRVRKIEIRNIFRSMSDVLNTYKREYGKIEIDIQHVNKVAEVQTALAAVAEGKQQNEEGQSQQPQKLGQKLLVVIRSTKNKTILAALNYTLSPRAFSRLKREEKAIVDQYAKITAKRDNLQALLEKAQSPEAGAEKVKGKRGRKPKAQKEEAVQEQKEPAIKTSAYKKNINQMISTLKKSGAGKKLLNELKQDPAGKALLKTLRHPENFVGADAHKEETAAAA